MDFLVLNFHCFDFKENTDARNNNAAISFLLLNEENPSDELEQRENE
jgi:hypothetical protein